MSAAYTPAQRQAVLDSLRPVMEAFKDDDEVTTAQWIETASRRAICLAEEASCNFRPFVPNHAQRLLRNALSSRAERDLHLLSENNDLQGMKECLLSPVDAFDAQGALASALSYGYLGMSKLLMPHADRWDRAEEVICALNEEKKETRRLSTPFIARLLAAVPADEHANNLKPMAEEAARAQRLDVLKILVARAAKDDQGTQAIRTLLQSAFQLSVGSQATEIMRWFLGVMKMDPLPTVNNLMDMQMSVATHVAEQLTLAVSQEQRAEILRRWPEPDQLPRARAYHLAHDRADRALTAPGVQSASRPRQRP